VPCIIRFTSLKSGNFYFVYLRHSLHILRIVVDVDDVDELLIIFVNVVVLLE